METRYRYTIGSLSIRLSKNSELHAVRTDDIIRLSTPFCTECGVEFDFGKGDVIVQSDWKVILPIKCSCSEGTLEVVR